jgi:methyltransferase (TIGR00027 family)
MGRAMAHARGNVNGFSDPFALQLLPEEHRAAVERLLRRQWPRTRRELGLRLVAQSAEWLMGPRTAEIDDGLRGLPPGHQLVILGAGLDARAYRMQELAQSAAFEVDHPATQAMKKDRTAGWPPVTRELHHVPVDFVRERIGDALERAGHRSDVPTAWVFEGVITYLSRDEVEASLDSIASRSAPGSRLLLTYNEPSRVRRLLGHVTRQTAEPPKVAFAPEEMRRLLQARGFVVTSDRDGRARALRWVREPSWPALHWFRFHHVAIADTE